MTTPDLRSASPAGQEVPSQESGVSTLTAGSGSALAPKVSRRKKILLALLALLLLLLAILFGWYLTNRKPLSELPGLRNEGMPHYAFSMYGTTRPLGVAVSPSGERIYVTESDGSRLVKVFNRGGKQVGILQPPKAAGASHVPVYVAVHPITGAVYVSDRMTQSIYVYDVKGKRSTFSPGGKLGGGWQPLGLTFDKGGNLYVTDVSSKPHRVLQFGPDGKLLRTLGAKAGLSFPNGIGMDNKGTAYVGDSNNGRVVSLDAAGTLTSLINRGVGQGDVGLPRGVAIDSRNRLYVVDTSSHFIKVYRLGATKVPSVTFLGSFGDEGQLDGKFEYPNGVAVDTKGRVYVTDRENNRVQVWSY